MQFEDDHALPPNAITRRSRRRMRSRVAHVAHESVAREHGDLAVVRLVLVVEHEGGDETDAGYVKDTQKKQKR